MPARRNIALSRKDLHQRVWSEPLRIVAKESGVTGSALAKICDRLLVPYPPRGYWVKLNAGKAPARASLPAVPEANARQVTISNKPASSRRARTRLDPAARRERVAAAGYRPAKIVDGTNFVKDPDGYTIELYQRPAQVPAVSQAH